MKHHTNTRNRPCNLPQGLDRDITIYLLFKSILVKSRKRSTLSEIFSRYRAAFHMLHLKYFRNKNIYKHYCDFCADIRFCVKCFLAKFPQMPFYPWPGKRCSDEHSPCGVCVFPQSSTQQQMVTRGEPVHRVSPPPIPDCCCWSKHSSN